MGASIRVLKFRVIHSPGAGLCPFNTLLITFTTFSLKISYFFQLLRWPLRDKKAVMLGQKGGQ
jgi:hypothetical protein